MTTKLSPTKTVYGFTYPETKKIVETLWEEKPHHLYGNVATAWQDDFHEAFLDLWEKRADCVDVSDLRHRYQTNGSSEAIREVISLHIANNRGLIHVFGGEYEGYEAYTSGLGGFIKRHDREDWTSLQLIKPGEAFFLSEPHSRDGNWWDRREEFLRLMDKMGVRVHLDLTYLGTGSLRNIEIPPSVQTVFFSLSKVYGVYYHRIGGCFSREVIPNLYGNKWFKNMFSIELGMRLLQEHPLGSLASKYRHLQTKAIEIVGRGSASDVIMLANEQTTEASLRFTRVQAADGTCHNRYCLTPIMESLTDHGHFLG